jgi:tight adherence protein C
MDYLEILFLALVFAIVAGLVGLVAYLSRPAGPRERLARVTSDAVELPIIEARGWVEKAARIAKPFMKLSVPEEGWEHSALRTRFMTAGLRSRHAPALFFASKTMLALGIPLFVLLAMLPLVKMPSGQAVLFILLAAASIGYYLPNLVLAQLARRRQREIFENIPDALDLLTVCVEAGLSLERGLMKVAGEIHIKSVVLAQELQLVLMEMRTGFTKEKALRNFALRSGVEDIDTLVAMLVQSERFGTSMGDALRVHSDNLRVRRRMAAEEMAAKISLKLMFPLIFCIFPTLLIVLLGPAFIQITRTLLPAVSGLK